MPTKQKIYTALFYPVSVAAFVFDYLYFSSAVYAHWAASFPHVTPEQKEIWRRNGDYQFTFTAVLLVTGLLTGWMGIKLLRKKAKHGKAD